MEMKKEISERSKKNEILDAYNEILEKVKGQKTLDRRAEKKVRRKRR